MKIVMEKNRTRREIREALREVYEQVAETAADVLMFDFEAENLAVEEYLAFDCDGVWGLDRSLFDEEDFKRWEKELRKALIDWSGLGDACNKMYEVIHSLHLSEDVLNDDDALDAILREKGVVK